MHETTNKLNERLQMFRYSVIKVCYEPFSVILHEVDYM